MRRTKVLRQRERNLARVSRLVRQTCETAHISAKVCLTIVIDLSPSLRIATVDKIRRNLVENAKIKRSYDKLKARERSAHNPSQDHLNDQQKDDITAQEPVSLEPHPDRQALMQDAPPERAIEVLGAENDHQSLPSHILDEYRSANKRHLYVNNKRAQSKRPR